MILERCVGSCPVGSLIFSNARIEGPCVEKAPFFFFFSPERKMFIIANLCQHYLNRYFVSAKSLSDIFYQKAYVKKEGNFFLKTPEKIIIDITTFILTVQSPSTRILA